MCAAWLPHLKAKQAAYLINVSSGLAYVPLTRHPATAPQRCVVALTYEYEGCVACSMSAMWLYNCIGNQCQVSCSAVYQACACRLRPCTGICLQPAAKKFDMTACPLTVLC